MSVNKETPGSRREKRKPGSKIEKQIQITSINFDIMNIG